MYKNKFNINIMALIFIMFSLGSCQKELLHPIPESILTTANAFKTAKDINLAVLGIYSNLQARVQTDYSLMEMPSGNMFGLLFLRVPGIQQISVLSVDADNPRINSFWKDCYNGIFLVNNVLAKIDIPKDYTTSQKEQFTGEAKFLRAVYYFDLVRIFGGVPEITRVITTEESKKIGRSTEQEIYNLIVKDLQDAINTLPQPSATAWGRASKGAAVALLAKVYVYLKDWNNAKKYLDQLFSEFHYNLLSNYADLFQIETEKNNETIFSIAYVAGTNGESLAYGLAPRGGVKGLISDGFSTDFGSPSWDLRKNFEDGDTRLAATITDNWLPFSAKPGDPTVWYPYFNKFLVLVPSDPESSGLDIPVLRLADLILLNAETLYNLNKPDLALAEINKVRERAFGNTTHDYQLSDIATNETFYDKLLLERRLELAVENNRWFDLVRTGRFTTVLQGFAGYYSSATGGDLVTVPIHAKSYMKVFPIPNEQIQLADPGVLKQNEGY